MTHHPSTDFTPMNNPVDLSAIGRVNDLQEQIERHQASMVTLAVEAGTELIKLKEQVPEGEWMAFCRDNIQIGRANINNYMQAAQHSELLPDYQRAGNGSIRGFLKNIKEHNRPPEPVAPPEPRPFTRPTPPTDESPELDIPEEECLRRLEEITNTMPKSVREKLKEAEVGKGYDLSALQLATHHKALMKELAKLSRNDCGKLMNALMRVLELNQQVVAHQVITQVPKHHKLMKYKLAQETAEVRKMKEKLVEGKVAINELGMNVMFKSDYKRFLGALHPDKHPDREEKYRELFQDFSAYRDKYENGGR